MPPSNSSHVYLGQSTFPQRSVVLYLFAVGETGKQRGIFHSLVPFPNVHTSQGGARPKSGTWDLSQPSLPCGRQGLNCLNHPFIHFGRSRAKTQRTVTQSEGGSFLGNSGVYGMGKWAPKHRQSRQLFSPRGRRAQSLDVL